MNRFRRLMATTALLLSASCSGIGTAIVGGARRAESGPLDAVDLDAIADTPVDINFSDFTDVQDVSETPVSDATDADITRCADGTSPCDGLCADLQTSMANCGGCGVVCAPLQNATARCVSGICTYSGCRPDFADCNGVPGDGCETVLATSAQHCGGCGRVCAPGNATGVCRDGTCAIAACGPGFADCDRDPLNGCEENLATSLNHCGMCGRICVAPNASPTCRTGACGVARCDRGFADCDGNPTNGCETVTDGDIANCGRCGVACPTPATGSAVCSSGVCGLSICAVGRIECGGPVRDDCETDSTTTMNCGACRRVCATPPHALAVCTRGACAMGACEPGYADCNSDPADGCEVRVSDDLGNCGGCGRACRLANAMGVCRAGACAVSACAPGFADCNGDPMDGCEVNTNANEAHCSGCGRLCAPPNATGVCSTGRCAVAMCTSGFADCNAVAGDGCEANLASDVGHCGGCGRACGSANGAPSCALGTCTIACAAGFGDCDGVNANGCETSTASSVLNCGGCGQSCVLPHATPGCVGGACRVASCESGYADCDATAANGCETHVAVDVMHCGTCGNACPSMGGPASCVGGVCRGGGCPAGFANCDGIDSNGCETNILNSLSNCGGCGTACGAPNATATCVGAACGVAMCSAGYANCDGLYGNGCEVLTATDLNNCGSCGSRCAPANATGVCNSGVCAVGSCAAGFADCNAMSGCETNTASNPSACGGCFTICTAPMNASPTCVSGVCGFACNAGFANCNGDPLDGCEVSLASNREHCSACGNACGLNRLCSSGTCVCDMVSTLCSLSCVNTQTDAANCGSCGNACMPGQSCSAGVCTTSTCVGGPRLCGLVPTDTCTDPSNCGVCGASCGGTSICFGGACVLCPAGQSRCGNICVTLNGLDSLNCGMCGFRCLLGTSCVSGVCLAPSDSGVGTDIGSM